MKASKEEAQEEQPAVDGEPVSDFMEQRGFSGEACDLNGNDQFLVDFEEHCLVRLTKPDGEERHSLRNLRLAHPLARKASSHALYDV